MGLRQPACWDCGFEYRRGRGCPLLLSVVCRKVDVSATGRSLVQRSPTEFIVDAYARARACVCVIACAHLQEWPPTLTVRRYKEVKRRKKMNRTKIETHIIVSNSLLCMSTQYGGLTLTFREQHY